MIGNYLGFYAMEERRLEAFSRLILTQLRTGQDSQTLLSAQAARNVRNEKRATLGNYNYMYRQGQRLTAGMNTVMEIEGPLSRHGECNEGYEDMAGFIRGCADNAAVKKIGLKMDTPGGAVDGVVAVAEAIKYARKKGKHVSAWGGFIASAGYFIASQCDSVFLDDQKSSSIGSIGVLMMYMNQAGALEKEGIKVEIIRAEGSDDKARVNSIEILTDEARAKIMAELKDLRGEFLGYVRRGRSGKLNSNEWERAAMYNIKEASKIGLIDGAMRLDEWLNFLNS